jgi:hypothetical protein
MHQAVSILMTIISKIYEGASAPFFIDKIILHLA